MKMVKSLILGSAASIAVLGGAQAADLPVKAKAVEYVRICSLYGAGFYYIPGTDTCMRIGGSVQIDVGFNTGTYHTPYFVGGATGTGANNAQAFGKNWFSDRARFNLTDDTRTATEYGVLRTYANVQFDWTGQGTSGIAGGAPVEVDYAFIQFAGFTIGKAVSEFDSQWALNKPTMASGFLNGSNDGTGLPQLAYTASFGNGVSATISLEDAQPYRTAGLVNTSQTVLNLLVTSSPAAVAGSVYGVGNFTGNSVGGDHVPDVVGNLRLDQAWGSLHFGAAAHEVHGNYFVNFPITGSPSDNGHVASTYGYAVTGAFELKNLPTGAGDSFKAEATFAHGAAKYAWGGTYDSAGAGRFARTSGTDPGTIAMGYVLDGAYANGGSIQLSNAWSVDGFFEHYWNPQWRTSLFASYSKITYGTGAGSAGDLLATALSNPSATMNPLGHFNFAPGIAPDMGFAIGQVGTRTGWQPVKDLTFYAEFLYTRMMPSATGTFTSTGFVSGSQNPSIWTIGAQNIYDGEVRVTRAF